MPMSWIERALPTARWRGFIAWLAVGQIGPLPVPNTPPQQWPRLPLFAVRQAAEAAGPWLLTVLKERRQRGLGWREERDAPLLAADLAIQPLGADAGETRLGWQLWHVQSELARLIRLVEAPERLLPAREGMPSEARYRALAVVLLRLGQMYAALEEGQERAEAAEQFVAAAARARQRATEVKAAAA